MAVSLLVAVCWDRGDEPGGAATALRASSAEAADALPGDSGVTTAAEPGDSGVTTAAEPGGSTGVHVGPSGELGAHAGPSEELGVHARPSGEAGAHAGPSGELGVHARPSREPGAHALASRQPGTHTGAPSRAPASRTATSTPAPGSAASRPPGSAASRPPASRAPGSRPPGLRHHTGAPRSGERDQRATSGPGPIRTPAPTARSPRPPASSRPLPPSRAVRLLIPYLRLDAPVMDLGLDRDHRLTAPPKDDPELVGWYRHGASPGGQGTAVAVGHLDTDSGPAVFAGLTELEPGRMVEVRRADGRIAVYVVDKIRTYQKENFPSQEVYGARGRPELRLITCSGDYDRRNGYAGNLVVFAHLTGTR